MKKFTLLCSAALFLGYLLPFLLFTYLWVVPVMIPGTPINIRGLVALTTIVLVYIFFLKRYRREEPEASIGNMMSIVLLSAILSEAGFQMIRQFTLTEATQAEHAWDFLRSVLLMTVYASVLGFFVAYQIKIRKILHLIAIILVLLVIANLFR